MNQDKETSKIELFVKSPIGPFSVEGTKTQIQRLRFHRNRIATADPDRKIEFQKRGHAEWMNLTRHWMEGYFSGNFDRDRPSLNPAGTEFQRAVWNELLQIRPGSPISYGTLAKRLGKTRASRAVGQACARNPIPLLIPCHRVVRSDGNKGSYSGPEGGKSFLLDHEQSNH